MNVPKYEVDMTARYQLFFYVYISTDRYLNRGKVTVSVMVEKCQWI